MLGDSIATKFLATSSWKMQCTITSRTLYQARRGKISKLSQVQVPGTKYDFWQFTYHRRASLQRHFYCSVNHLTCTSSIVHCLWNAIHPGPGSSRALHYDLRRCHQTNGNHAESGSRGLLHRSKKVGNNVIQRPCGTSPVSTVCVCVRGIA
jgi:hypothetical protein